MTADVKSKKCIAMLLAGGKGTRLRELTSETAKPAVGFGGKYRLIDFPLSNCVNSGIDTVGVLTQYQPLELAAYIGSGNPWDLDRVNGGVTVLPPFRGAKSADWYLGTADAVRKNLNFVDLYSPECTLIISGDHIYRMDYSDMLEFHTKNACACTLAVIRVAKEEASRFGVVETGEDMRVRGFHEKPDKPSSDMVSMGIYIFNTDKLKEYLSDPDVCDFGKDLIPKMLEAGERLFAYRFTGYWRDVGTVGSLWRANMDLLGNTPAFCPGDHPKILSRPMQRPAQFVGETAEITDSLISDGCRIFGKVSGSVLSGGVTVEAGACIIDSVIMEDAVVEKGAIVRRAIVGKGCVIRRGSAVGNTDGEPSLIIGSLTDTRTSDGDSAFAYRDRHETKKT